MKKLLVLAVVCATFVAVGCSGSTVTSAGSKPATLATTVK